MSTAACPRARLDAILGTVTIAVVGLWAGIASASPPPDPTPVGDSDAPAPAPAPEPAEPAAVAPVEGPDTRPAALGLESSASSTLLRVEALDPDREGEVIELGSPPVRVELPAGRYRLKSEGPGYQPWSQEIELGPGQELELQVEPELVEGARLRVSATDEGSVGASVSLDGAVVCELPCDTRIEPGTHQLELRKRRRKGLSFPIEVAQADELDIEVSLEPATSRAPAIVTGAVALTTLSVAIGFTVRADQTRRSLASDLAALEQYDGEDRRLDNGRRDAVVAASMYGVTAAVGLLTLYYLLRQPGPPSRADMRKRNLARARWRLTPSFGPQGGGLTGVVAF